MPLLKTYLIAFFLYSMGVQTVMLAASLFASQEIGLSESKLIISLLLIQIVAIAGAYIMAKLSDKFGNLKVLIFTVLLWVLICISAYYTVTEIQFYILAAVVGLVMGGIQSLSRSTYSKIMPPTHDTTSFFSFYDVTEKVAIVIGLFCFGFVHELTGNMRNAIFALIIFFILGLIFLFVALKKQRKHSIL